MESQAPKDSLKGLGEGEWEGLQYRVPSSGKAYFPGVDWGWRKTLSHKALLSRKANWKRPCTYFLMHYSVCCFFSKLVFL